MRRYIYGERNGMHIINLRYTAQTLIKALRLLLLKQRREEGIICGTKRSASNVVAEQAVVVECICESPMVGWYIDKLQNDHVQKLIQMEADIAEGRLENRTKRLNMEKDMKKWNCLSVVSKR